VAQIVNTEQLQHYTPQKHGLFEVHNYKYTATGHKKNNNNNKINIIISIIFIVNLLFSSKFTTYDVWLLNIENALSH